MSNTSSIFELFTFLINVMLFGVWSNIYAYVQQSSSSSRTLWASSLPTGFSPVILTSKQRKLNLERHDC
jgi:hypothetical protein